MGSSSIDGVDFPSTSKEDCSETSVEIKIKTLDSQTYTLRVDKYVPVPVLKEKIANVTGVHSEQQRLICRGKVLKDDQLLSAYHVEDGHTLHLVVREPISSASSTTPSLVGSGTLPNHLGSSPLSNTFPLTSGLVFGTVNPAGQGDQTTDLSHILSSVIGSLGVNNFGTDGAVGYDFERSRRRTRDGIASSDSSQSQTDQASARAGFDPYRGLQFPSTISSGNQQPTIIPDSCTTLTEYINHMRHEFDANSVRESNSNSNAPNSHRSEGQRHDSHQHLSARQGLPTPASLAEVMLSARQLLIEQAAECLSEFAAQLQNHGNVTNSLTRASIQSDAIRSGVHLQNLGPLLLELGRTIMTLRMGQSPEEAVVNAGPSIFLSASGPNPIMVQAGTNFSGFSMGTIHPGQGPTTSLGPGVLARNIDITIRRGQATGNADGTSQADGFQQLENMDTARNSVTNSVHEVLQAGMASAGREPTVRFVPIRTVIAIPSSSHRPSNSSGESDASLHSLFGRLQQQVLGNINDTRSPLASNEHNVEVPEGSIMDADSNINDTHGSEQIHYNPVADVLTGSGVEAHVTDRCPQTLATGSAGDQTVTNTEEDNFSRHNNDGVFFSALVRQLMPLLSQIGTSEDSVVSSLNPDFSSEQAEDQNPTDASSCIDLPDAPLAKRQKRE